MGYYMSAVAVVCRPQRDQELPICALNGLDPQASCSGRNRGNPRTLEERRERIVGGCLRLNQ
jgi:hypothetical protein